MNKAISKAFIWDLDGTLLDSYEVILNSLHKACLDFGIYVDKKKIYEFIIDKSVSAFMEKLKNEYNASINDLKNRYSFYSQNDKFLIKRMNHSLEILKYLKENGVLNLVYTHRGTTTKDVLENVSLYDLFDEILTSKSGFKRKPDPEAINYFIDKYNLDKENTYYVGDRNIDILCANNAGIKSILYISLNSVSKPTNKEDYVINDLLDIKKLIV